MTTLRHKVTKEEFELDGHCSEENPILSVWDKHGERRWFKRNVLEEVASGEESIMPESATTTMVFPETRKTPVGPSHYIDTLDALTQLAQHDGTRVVLDVYDAMRLLEILRGKA